MVYRELHVQGASHDLHSGVYGGAAPNPIMAIAEILCALKDRDGHIHDPRLLRPRAAAERRGAGGLGTPALRRARSIKQKEIGRRAHWPASPSVHVLERTWARPTLEVHGIRGGFTGEGAKTVIPARAVAKISMRLVADQRPGRGARAIPHGGRESEPEGSHGRGQVAARRGAFAGGSRTTRSSTAAAKAMQEVFGNETVYIRSGGSIPIVGVVQTAPGHSQRA